ncbi:DNA polymerase beta domain protein region [Staphylothermus hellenicus DSM 12710]|uniref:DNA polymerase beta domain protein region n=2 Tax=Staphylothermus hellenicus TaxID=84599 RepID=D7D8C5_STAHD|nr:DNA polymerase beta domain protein region [Staphylothermus hellenicus DSM 12710]
MARLIREWRMWSRRVAEAAEKVLGECKVYVFGSVAEGRATGGSDVDILIVSKNTPSRARDRWELIARIEEEAGLPLFHPYQIHLVNNEEAKWYYKHIRKKIQINTSHQPQKA